MENFEIGDLVYLKSGSDAFTVSGIKGIYGIEIQCFYNGSLYQFVVYKSQLCKKNPYIINGKYLNNYYELKKIINEELVKTLEDVLNQQPKTENKLREVLVRDILDNIIVLNRYSGGYPEDVFKLHSKIVNQIKSNKLENLFDFSEKPNG